MEEKNGGQHQVMSEKRHAMGGRGETDRKERGDRKGREGGDDSVPQDSPQ